MARITRARRAELLHRAQEIRRARQRAGDTVEQIASAIRKELPEVLPLEAWRLAYGWSRPQAIDAIAAVYEEDQLAAPPVTSSMLCRWEHGEVSASIEYAQALCRVYHASATQLGLAPMSAILSPAAGPQRYGQPHSRTPRNGYSMTGDNQAAALAALRESIELALEVEGPSGGSLARQHLAEAVEYYARHYSKWPPSVLAAEVHRTRALVNTMLRQPQDTAARADLRLAGGWLSALVGNLAFHLGDYPAAHVHFGTAARLGTAVGHDPLICWTLGAQAMTAYTQHRYPEALELATQALEYADTPLRRAQILAWGQLRPMAAMGAGYRSDVNRVAAAAQDEMAADPDGETPGRFGFDLAELHLHLAEARLLLGDHAAARTHAITSQQHIPRGRPGWGTALLLQARAIAAAGHRSDAASLAHEVLNTIPAPALRETLRVRLHALDRDLFAAGDPGRSGADLRERISSLPPLQVAHLGSDEPNGHDRGHP
jgi:tetratricopeptide (TPR) repeat protein